MFNVISMKQLKYFFVLIILFTSCQKEPSPPSGFLIFTKSADLITFNSAVAGGNITTNGQLDIIEKGICWSNNPDPTIQDNKQASGVGTGNFSNTITGLISNTKYYIKAYAKISDGSVFYGKELNFTTLATQLGIVKTLSINTITLTSANANGSVISNGGASIIYRGICWSTQPNPTVNNNTINSGYGTGDFTALITGLQPSSTYYVRAYANNSIGTAYGANISFRTLAPSLPIISTSSVSSITSSSANSGGNITSDGGASVIQRGICWSTGPVPTISNSLITIDGTGTGSFTSYMTGLTSNTYYYVRAYATNSAGTSYGSTSSFTTIAVSLPKITTSSISSITSTSAYSGGNITSDGGATITKRGVCWSSATSFPTIGNINTSSTNEGTGAGSFTSFITGLSPNTNYYVRAYATNSAGTSYGTVYTFTSNPVVSLPTVTTTFTSSITSSSAYSGGNISSSGGASVTQRGVCWSSTTSLPSITNVYSNSTNDGTGTGSFTSYMTGLSPKTLYYVRAYAINTAGTSYGTVYTFTTNSIVSLPTITTTSVSSITTTSAYSGGNIISGGGATVTQRGVCWSSTTSLPSINNIYSRITNDGTGIGSFTSYITGLSPNTNYYVRAYATNTVGTSYGTVYTFRTKTIGTPTLQQPINGTSYARGTGLFIQFGWSSVTGADSYEIEFSSSSLFLSIYSNQITTNAFINYSLVNFPNSYCYWKVRAISGGVYGNWSSSYYMYFY